MVKVTHNSVKDVRFENVDGMGPVKEFPWNLLQKLVDNINGQIFNFTKNCK